jgi:hypothetical protein
MKLFHRLRKTAHPTFSYVLMIILMALFAAACGVVLGAAIG